MDDLRRRFASLDRLRAPDLWNEIELRAAALGSTERVAPVTVPIPLRSRVDRRPLALLGAAALLVGLLAGAIALGSGLIKLPVILPAPSPAPQVFSCEEARQSAGRRVDGWVSGPPADDSSGAQPGWIAVWGTDAEPELVLVNPLTGETCSLTTFSGSNAPPGTATPDSPTGWIPERGPLAWSPDGRALAIVVIDAEPCCRHALYVWSDLGLAGPIIEVRHPSYLHVPSWSPDGSLLAIGESNGGSTGPLDPASAWIIAGDGSAPREVRADCDACFGGSVYWSPSGGQIAFRTWTTPKQAESPGMAAGNVDDQLVPLLPSTSGGDALLGWAGDASLWVVAFGETVPVAEPEGAGHLFEVPLDPRLDRIDHGFLPAGPGVSPSGVALSPDGTQLLQFVERPRVLIGDLMVAGFPTGEAERLVEGLPSARVWWSPDGRTVGYLIDVQTPDQGIWLVNADGTGLRKLVGGSLTLGHEAFGVDATLFKVWQPVWPGESR
ncbi:MAG: hypothetical protein ABIO99_01130 [Candidatus Limnocylindria bacterium]